ncbi:MAG: hypothetical protein Q4G67_04875 [Actinomycetia bacterium]|nr:hypothetical protein [Actinomycetes bacterium]
MAPRESEWNDRGQDPKHRNDHEEQLWSNPLAEDLDWSLEEHGLALRWSPGTVMPWRAVEPFLSTDDPEAEYWARVDLEEHQLAAREGAALQELRGIFLGQAAEVEAVVVRTTLDLGLSKRTATFSQAVVQLKEETVRRGISTPEVETWFGHLNWLRQRRNELMHATLNVGLARDTSGDLVPVISLFEPVNPPRDDLRSPEATGRPEDGSAAPNSGTDALAEGGPVKGARNPDWRSAPGAPQGLRPPSSPLVDEFDLKIDAWRAWKTTCSAVQIRHILLLNPDCQGPVRTAQWRT